jgi:hypothetical protein
MIMAKECENCFHQSEFKSVECGSCIVSYYDGEQQGLPSNFKPKPKTNADRIRAMSDEELADVVANGVGCVRKAPHCMEEDCTPCILQWLKQPVGDE